MDRLQIPSKVHLLVSVSKHETEVNKPRIPGRTKGDFQLTVQLESNETARWCNERVKVIIIITANRSLSDTFVRYNHCVSPSPIVSLSITMPNYFQTRFTIHVATV